MIGESRTVWRDLARARQLLLADGVVGIPTETVYGLAARVSSEVALKQIFAIKERPYFDPLIVHVADFAELGRLTARWSELEQHLAEQFWPGPLTLVAKKSERVHPLITAGLDTVGLRWPSHPVARRLIREVGPLAAPSANKFGKTSPTQRSHVERDLPGVFVLEGGPAQIGLESTVVQCVDREIHILRPGFITAERLARAAAELGGELSVREQRSRASPGHLQQHYQPPVPLVMVAEALWPVSDLKRAEIFGQLNLFAPRTAELKLHADPTMAARWLFADLRSLAETNDLIWVVRRAHQEGELWRAIWDRLQRAKHFLID